MTNKHRPTKSKKAALRYLPIYETLLHQIKSGNPKGAFLSTEDFNGVGVQTLQNRFTDALSWLMENNIDGTSDRRQEFQNLRASMRTKKEDSGVRVMILSGPSPASILRPTTQPEQPADWKEKIQRFLDEDFTEENVVREIGNCLVTDRDWLDKVTRAYGASYNIRGDSIVVVRSR